MISRPILSLTWWIFSNDPTVNFYFPETSFRTSLTRCAVVAPEFFFFGGGASRGKMCFWGRGIQCRKWLILAINIFPSDWGVGGTEPPTGGMPHPLDAATEDVIKAKYILKKIGNQKYFIFIFLFFRRPIIVVTTFWKWHWFISLKRNIILWIR